MKIELGRESYESKVLGYITRFHLRLGGTGPVYVLTTAELFTLCAMCLAELGKRLQPEKDQE